MTSQNNRACFYTKPSVAVHLWWIETGVTVWKHQIRVKIFSPCDLANWRITVRNNTQHCVAVGCPNWQLLSPVTLGWPWEARVRLFYATSSCVHHFLVIGEFKLELQSGNPQIGAIFVLNSVTLIFDHWPWSFAWTPLLSTVLTPEIFMMIRWQKHCEKGVTDRQRDWWTKGRIGGQTEVFLELLRRS